MELKVKMLWLFTEVLLGGSAIAHPGLIARFADKWNRGLIGGFKRLSEPHAASTAITR